MSLGRHSVSKNVSSKAHISYIDSRNLLDSFLKTILNQPKNTIVKLSNFGTFRRKTSPERVGRNPKSGKSYLISKRSKLVFNCSNKIRNIIN